MLYPSKCNNNFIAIEELVEMNKSSTNVKLWFTMYFHDIIIDVDCV